MRPAAAGLGALLLAACVGSAALEIEVPPPRPERAPVPAAGEAARTPTDDGATERFLDSEIERRAAPSHRTPDELRRAQRNTLNQRPPTDEQATEIFLDHEIERRRYVAPAPPPERIVARTYVEVPQSVRDPYQRGYDRYRSRFPWNTAVGAGIGAVIGHQSGHRDQGAAIGAGVGLLFDLARWH